MARIRTIKPEFWTDEKVMDLTPLARLLFIGLWNFCDDYGRMPYVPRTIKAQIFPDDAIGVAEIEAMLRTLVGNGQVILYPADGKIYLAIAKWDRHQKIDNKAKPKCPAPLIQSGTGGEHSEILASPSEDLEKIVSEKEGKGQGQEQESDKDKGKESDRDAEIAARAIENDLRAAIASAFEAAGSPNPPDTSRVALWLSQRYEPAIILAVITDIVKRKPSVGTLNYFDTAIREAHAQKAPKRIELTTREASLDIEAAVKLYARTQRWSRWAGPEPGMINCRAGPELLAKYGLRPDGSKAERAMSENSQRRAGATTDHEFHDAANKTISEGMT